MKKFISLWLALVLTAALCACGSEPEQTAAPVTDVTAVTDSAAVPATEMASASSSVSVTSTAAQTTVSVTKTEETKATTVPTRIDMTTWTATATEKSVSSVTAETKKTEATVVTDTTDTSGETTPSAFEPQEGYYYAVYLASGSYTSIEVAEEGSVLLVKSSKSARLMDGTLFGPICYTYRISDPDFSKETIQKDIPDGTFYLVDHTGTIISSIGTLFSEKEPVTERELVETVPYSYTYTLPTVQSALSSVYFGTMTITSAEKDTILATVDGKENVDITDRKVQFLYSDVDGTQFYAADDNTSVSLVNFDIAVSSIEAAYKKAALAEAVYFSYDTDSGKGFTAAKEAYESAKAELEAAKQTVINKYFNGRFWGSGSLTASPLGVYFAKVQNTFNKKASLSFRYFENGDTLFVLVPTFVLG